MIRFLLLSALASVAAFAQIDGAPQDSYFQIRYASNLTVADSVINLTNTGAASRTAFVTADGPQDGNLCVHVYAYTPDEQLASCCSCYVTPNGLNSLSVKTDLASNPLTPVVPSSMVIKLLAEAGKTSASACNAAVVNPTNLANGLAAWGTTTHAVSVSGGAATYQLGETRFTNGSLSGAEFQRMTQLCAFIRANGSGYGLCKSCRLGGLAASNR
jgi:hypothetical protein